VTKKPETTVELLNLLNEALSDLSGGDRERLKADLSEEGVDLDEAVAGVLRLVEDFLSNESWQERARRERAAVLERIKHRRQDTHIHPSIVQRKAADLQMHAQFRNFEKATERDVESLLDDEDLVKQLEQMHQESDEGK